jgi:hypothetical protein
MTNAEYSLPEIYSAAATIASTAQIDNFFVGLRLKRLIACYDLFSLLRVVGQGEIISR